MDVTLSLPEDMAEAVTTLAKKTGQAPEGVLLDALRSYFPPVPSELQAEFDALERASDDDFQRFERSLEVE